MDNNDLKKISKDFKNLYERMNSAMKELDSLKEDFCQFADKFSYAINEKSDLFYEYISVEEMEFSRRTYNALKKAGINNLKDLTSITKKRLKKFRLIGDKCMEEIERFFQEHEINFKE